MKVAMASAAQPSAGECARDAIAHASVRNTHCHFELGGTRPNETRMPPPSTAAHAQMMEPPITRTGALTDKRRSEAAWPIMTMDAASSIRLSRAAGESNAADGGAMS